MDFGVLGYSDTNFLWALRDSYVGIYAEEFELSLIY